MKRKFKVTTVSSNIKITINITCLSFLINDNSYIFHNDETCISINIGKQIYIKEFVAAFPVSKTIIEEERNEKDS